MEYDFAKKVELVLQEKGKTKKSLYSSLAMTANGFDAMLRNNSISAVRLAQIADFLEVPVPYFYGMSITKSEDGGAFGEKVLGAMAQDIHELKQFFEEELRIKNQQIAGLQRTVDVLVGKSEGATLEPLSPEVEKFEKQLGEYKDLMRNPFRRKTLHKFQSGVKSVARR